MTTNKPPATKPFPATGRHRRTSPVFRIAAAYRPTGGTLLVTALLALALFTALGGGPAIMAGLYNWVYIPLLWLEQFFYDMWSFLLTPIVNWVNSPVLPPR